MHRALTICLASLLLACTEGGSADTTSEGDVESEGDGDGDGESDTSSGDGDDPCAPLPADIIPAYEELSLQTQDGKQLAATLARPGSATCRPAVLLIHQYKLERSQWDAQVPAFVEAGYVTLAFDLRGHGESDAQDGALADILTDPDQAPLDLAAAVEALLAHEAVDPERLAIVGTSVGANLAVVGGHQHPEVQLTVPISPRVPPIEDLAGNPAQLSLRPMFCFAGELDGGGQAQACELLVGEAGGSSKLRVLPGTAAHGVTIVEDFPETIPDVIAWLDENL